MAQIEEVLTSSDEKHEQTIEPPVQERPAEKLPIIEKASSKLDEQDTRFFANELRDSGGMDADVESGGTEETGPQLIPSEAVNDEADLPQYNLRQNDDQKDSKDQRDSFDEKSANNVTPKNDENDDADIPPKTHFENQRYEAAKSGWERQIKSCNYVLTRVENPEAYAEDPNTKAALGNEKIKDYIDMRRKARLNLSLVCLKLNDFGKAVTYAEEVLAEEPSNEKALYRKALGLFESGKVTESAQGLVPLSASRDAAVIKLRHSVERQIVRKKEVEKRMMQGVFEEASRKSGTCFWTRFGYLFRRRGMGFWAATIGCCSVALGLAAMWGSQQSSLSSGNSFAWPASRGAWWWRQTLMGRKGD